jgi:hypothetical protein
LNLKYLIQGEVESNPKESTSDSDLNNLIEVGWTESKRMNKRFRSIQSHVERWRTECKRMNKWFGSKQSHRESKREDESNPKEWTWDSYLNNLIEWERMNQIQKNEKEIQI